MFALAMILALLIFFCAGFITGEAVASDFFFENFDKRMRAEKRRAKK